VIAGEDVGVESEVGGEVDGELLVDGGEVDDESLVDGGEVDGESLVDGGEDGLLVGGDGELLVCDGEEDEPLDNTENASGESNEDGVVVVVGPVVAGVLSGDVLVD
jgi:hypothetical protein